MDIEIERYETPKVGVYKSNGEYVGVFNNEHECNKFRVKMLQNNVTSDYYFMWGDVRINVSETGDLDKFPRGLYDELMHDMSEIFRIQQARRNKTE